MPILIQLFKLETPLISLHTRKFDTKHGQYLPPYWDDP